MKKLTFCLMISTLLFSCKSQQSAFKAIYGTFEGTEGLYNIELNLNQDGTCLLIKLFDLTKIACYGEWGAKDNSIEIKCNRNPELDDTTKALQGGCYIYDTLQVKVVNKNKLKIGNTILKRKSKI